MISHLDNLIRHLFMSQIPEIISEEQVRFQPPDDVWRTYVTGLTVDSQPVNALNVYLVELRENRKLRSNERQRSSTQTDGVLSQEPAAARIDCHYLVSAWSPATLTPTVEPTLDEHQLLYSVTSALFRKGCLNPSELYSETDVALQSWPEKYRATDLPLALAPVEGFQKLAEFWSSMGTGSRWKPVVYLIVSLPVELMKEVAGPIVTTRITEFRQVDEIDSTEQFIDIAGYVLDITVNPVQMIAEAWVQLEATDGTAIKTTTTNNLGQYNFSKLRPGRYQLRWRAADKAESAPRVVDIPSPTGEYDLKFE